MEVIVMKKKFVVAVAAVVMAAVMSVSAFAADDVKVPSITGDATGPHLHLEVWMNGVCLDPAVALKLPDA